MASSSSQRAIGLIVIVLIFGTKWGQCVKVSFYREENYKGFLEEKVLSGTQELQCVNLQSPLEDVKSIKTGKCLIAYNYPDCQWKFFPPPANPQSFRIDGDTPKTPMMVPNGVASFHVCSQKLGGGPQLDIYIYKRPTLPGFPFDKEYYEGVCGCRNVPSRLVGGQSRYFQTLNFGNSVNLYEGEDCRGRSKYIPAGMNKDSQAGNYGFDVRSFKPAELTNCYRLEAQINKFHFKNGTDSIEDLAVEKVQLAADSDIRNNGATEITQTYTVSSKISETVEFSVAESFTRMDSAGVEVGAEVTAEVGVPLIAKAEVKSSIAANYQWSQENSGGSTNTTTVSQEESIEIKQEIKIPPCKVCHVTSYVKKIKDFPVKYVAHAKVTAPEDSEQLSAEELRKNLPAGMEYVKDIDEHSIEGRTEGVMYVDFGLKSLIDVNCDPDPIPGCKASAYNPLDNHQVYEFPIYPTEKPIIKGNNSRHPNLVTFIKNAVGLLVILLG